MKCYFKMVNLLLNERKLQKNRFFRKNKKLQLKFGELGLFSSREGRLELIQLTMIKKIIKTFIRKRKNSTSISREKIWFLLVPNFILQKKSKNSRMGKGKGLFERKVIRLRRGSMLFEFKGISINKLNKLINKINKYVNLDFKIFFNKLYTYQLWSNKKKYNYYFNKYLSV